MDHSLILREAFVKEVSDKADMYLFSISPTFKQFIDAYFFAYTEKGGVQLGLEAPDIAVHFVEEMDNILRVLNENSKGTKLSNEDLRYLRDAAVSFLDNEASVRFILKCAQAMYRNPVKRTCYVHKVPVLQTGVPNRNGRIYELQDKTD